MLAQKYLKIIVFFQKLTNNTTYASKFSTGQKTKRWDNIFRRVIILAGVATIVCVLAILWSILKISIPLFKTNDIEKISAPTLANHSPLLYVTADEFLENVWGLSETGELVLQRGMEIFKCSKGWQARKQWLQHLQE